MRMTRQAGVVVLCVCAAVSTARGSAADAEATGPDRQLYAATVQRALQFLVANQSQDGSFSSQVGIGPTALATLALLRHGRAASTPEVAAAVKHLEAYTQESGGIHAPGSFISIYETCIALVCFKEAGRGAGYDEIVRKAEAFVRGGQWDERRDRDRSDLYYGGAGYGGTTRPDLSNTAFLIDTLKSCGAGPDDPAIQRALVFVSRCQNLESEHNTTAFAAKINDGGFYYTCAVDKQDEERQTAEGGLRSYGSMTYAGLKSMIYAGLTKDDPRVKAAIQWISNHYDVTTNPGMGEAGLYYYYHTFAKALDAFEAAEIEDAHGVKHDWRRELVAELARRQQPDGSWVNSNSRWMEGDANLSTAFAVLALSYCRPVSVEAAR